MFRRGRNAPDETIGIGAAPRSTLPLSSTFLPLYIPLNYGAQLDARCNGRVAST